MMELFVNSSILDIWLDSRYASEHFFMFQNVNTSVWLLWNAEPLTRTFKGDNIFILFAILCTRLTSIKLDSQFRIKKVKDAAKKNDNILPF